jgi:hypothetical protein
MPLQLHSSSSRDAEDVQPLMSFMTYPSTRDLKTLLVAELLIKIEFISLDNPGRLV